MVKRKLPAFQFYVDNFIVGTKDMTAEQVGGYILLLCHQWDKGKVPLAEKEIQSIAKISDENVKIILKKFSKKKSGYFNDRMEKERKKSLEYRKGQSEIGKRGGRPKKGTLKLPLSDPFQKKTSSSSSSSSTYVLTRSEEIIQQFSSNQLRMEQTVMHFSLKDLPELNALLKNFISEQSVISGGLERMPNDIWDHFIYSTRGKLEKARKSNSLGQSTPHDTGLN